MADIYEPAVREEDFAALLKGYEPDGTLTRSRDLVGDRYRIIPGQPLPELNSAFAKAYAARDDQSPDTPLYALVMDDQVPLRQKTISALTGFRHPNLVALLEVDVTEISILGQTRLVAILERPVGQSLSQILSQGRNPLSDTNLLNFVLTPLIELLVAFEDMNISHNRINLGSLYLNGSTIQLGECISEPSGYSQHPLFEPIDRLMADPGGKPDGALYADCYALAVVALHLSLGYQPYAQLSHGQIVELLLSKGAYHTLAVEWDFSDVLQDLLRALFNDTRRERLDPKVILPWLTGRRFNLIMPSQPRETSRGCEFMGHNYLSRKHLAEALFVHWQEGKGFLFDNRLPRWLESCAHKGDVADVVARIISNSGGDNARAERHNNDLLARIIMALDPPGPLRYRSISAFPEALGNLYALVYLHGEQEHFQLVAQLLESDLITYWIEMQKGQDLSALGFKMQRARQYLRMNALGFGPERCLYEFNPYIACQSPLVRRYHVTTLPELLLALDHVAATEGARQDPVDRHVAAFIASRLDLAKEVRIDEMDGIASLSSHSKLVSLKLLMRAQTKAKTEANLRGLSIWTGMRLLPLLEVLHKRSRKRKKQVELKQAAEQGSLKALADVILYTSVFVDDYNEFRAASAAYDDRRNQIALLQSQNVLARHARVAGRGIAQTISYGICLLTVYFTLKSYMHIL